MATYNEKYIKTFDEAIYEEALNNESVLNRIRNSYLHKYDKIDPNVSVEIQDILMKESLDHYVLKKLIDDPSFIDSQQMKRYIDHIGKIYGKTHTEITTNIIFRDDEIKEKIFDKHLAKHKEHLIKISEKNVNECNDILNKINDGEDITQDELNYVSKLLAEIRGFNLKNAYDVFLKFVFGNMRNTKLIFSYEVQDAVLTYLPKFYKNGYVENVRYVVGDTDRFYKINGPGHSSSVTNYVALSKEEFKNVNLNSIEDSNVERLWEGSDITFFMIVALHEITHQMQRAKSDSITYDDQGMGYVIHIITKNELRDYKFNHDSDEIEIDANEVGWEKAYNFFYEFYSGPDRDKLLRNCTVNRHTSNFRRTFAYKRDNNGEYQPVEEYDITKLFEILKNKPDYLEKYPMLKKFFSYDTEVTIKPQYMYNTDLYTDSTGISFINFFFNHGGIRAMIKHIEKTKLSNENITKLINNTTYFISEMFNRISKLEYIVDHNSAGEYNNNEEFSPEVAEKLKEMYFNKATECYKKVFPLYERIYELYPDSRGFIDLIMKYHNKDLNMNEEISYRKRAM